MGIQDRAYYRDDRPSWLSGRSVVVNLIIANVAVYVAESLFGDEFTGTLSLSSEVFTHPWNLWQLVTYAFVHQDNQHILFNMLGLWFFGTELEGIYGPLEFLRIYLAAAVVAGLAWVGFEAVNHVNSTMVGASGGVMGVVMLYCVHFPRRRILLWAVLPMPAWALGVLYVVIDLLGISQGDNVAHVAHLAGAAFGFAYYQFGWNLGRLVPSRLSRSTFRWRPRLRIHDPQEEASNFSEQVDRILEKISQQGEGSLTKKERHTLEEASRRYQQRRD